MAEGKRLYFTIGPVQTFVAQSRRTRDLWASSFLLSHLANEAMKAVEQGGGEIVLPARSKRSQAPAHGELQHGRWPNRFVAKVDDPSAAAKAAEQSFVKAWREIAGQVWEKYIEPVEADGNDTKAIWRRQVDHFWEITWVAAPPPQNRQPDPLACRKNWRTTPITVEPGDHCTMMGSWQELSGFIRSREREDQIRFWGSIRNRLGQLELAEDERLCAISFIKRMFPKVAGKLLGETVNSDRWFSTPYIAAIPWLKSICHHHADAAKAYLAKVDALCPKKYWRREDPTAISSRWKISPGCEEVVRLDGDLLHETALANRRDTPLGVPDEEDETVRAELLTALKELQKEVSSTPSSFYALLLMDGDSMGKLLSEARHKSGDAGERSVTEALGQFADAVPGEVSKHDGVTVYCGGDDVLAILPVDSALQCALSLSKLYRSKFEETAPEFAKQATISAGIVFCPFRAPLRQVIELAHRLLDLVAKDATGRDSLAVAVLKAGGVTCQWAAPWNHVSEAEGGGTVLDALVEQLRGCDERIGELSSGFLFQIRERFAVLTNDPLTSPGSFGSLPDGIEMKPLLLSEYRRAQSHLRDPQTEPSQNNAERTIDLLLKVCRRAHRTQDVDEKSLGIDGPLLVRFLAAETRKRAAEEAP